MKDTESIRALTKIFNSKNWFSNDKEQLVFDTFCNILEVLEPSERALIIELTDRYHWIPGDEYHKHIRDTIKDIPDDLLIGIKDMFLFPVMKLKDVGKIKSGVSIVYDLISMLPTIPKFKGIKPIPLNSFAEFDKGQGTKSGQLLCLVDDFIGSGNTLFQCLDEIEKRMTIDFKRLIIVCISCQKQTYDLLKGKGIKVFYKHLMERGISDFNAPPVIEEKKKLMRDIEKAIPSLGSYSLGYKESEALITLKRTPNNTFPFFWKRTRIDGKWYDAPFLRV